MKLESVQDFCRWYFFKDPKNQDLAKTGYRSKSSATFVKVLSYFTFIAPLSIGLVYGLSQIAKRFSPELSKKNQEVSDRISQKAKDADIIPQKTQPKDDNTGSEKPDDAPVKPSDAPVKPSDAPVKPDNAPVKPSDAPVKPDEVPVAEPSAQPKDDNIGAGKAVNVFTEMTTAVNEMLKRSLGTPTPENAIFKEYAGLLKKYENNQLDCAKILLQELPGAIAKILSRKLTPDRKDRILDKLAAGLSQILIDNKDSTDLLMKQIRETFDPKLVAEIEKKIAAPVLAGPEQSIPPPPLEEPPKISPQLQPLATPPKVPAPITVAPVESPPLETAVIDPEVEAAIIAILGEGNFKQHVQIEQSIADIFKKYQNLLDNHKANAYSCAIGLLKHLPARLNALTQGNAQRTGKAHARLLPQLKEVVIRDYQNEDSLIHLMKAVEKSFPADFVNKLKKEIDDYFIKLPISEKSLKVQVNSVYQWSAYAHPKDHLFLTGWFTHALQEIPAITDVSLKIELLTHAKEHIAKQPAEIAVQIKALSDNFLQRRKEMIAFISDNVQREDIHSKIPLLKSVFIEESQGKLVCDLLGAKVAFVDLMSDILPKDSLAADDYTKFTIEFIPIYIDTFEEAKKNETEECKLIFESMHDLFTTFIAQMTIGKDQKGAVIPIPTLKAGKVNYDRFAAVYGEAALEIEINTKNDVAIARDLEVQEYRERLRRQRP